MQYALPEIKDIYYRNEPLRYQLLKWIGNKQKFANEIISFFPPRIEKYYEPFLGSGAVLATLSPESGLGSDNFPPLIEIWKTLKEEPEILKLWYKDRWERMQKGDKKLVYEEIKKAYNKRPNGADLLFLSRSCYGGVIRFRKADGYMSTPIGIHSPIPSESFNKRVEEWNERIKNVEILLLDYREAMSQAKNGDLIYCDPPYKHSQTILYGAQGFDLDSLYNEIEKCKSRGVKIVLSIDGIKKSGEKNCDIHVPKELFKREIFIDCGRSMLKRFQMEGETLESEQVQDRLLLTY